MSLALVLLTPGVGRSQDIGPGPVTSSIDVGSTRTVLGSTQWTPPSGSVAASVGGSGRLTFDPAAGVSPGDITVSTVNAPAIVITGNGQIAVNPDGTPFLTTISTRGPNAYGLHVTSGQHAELLNNILITTSGANSDGIRIQNPNNTINATNVTIATTGAGASALALVSGGGSTARFTSSSLESNAGPVIRVQGGSNKNINLTGSSVTAGGGDERWLYVTGGASPVNITASRTTLTGAAITDSGSTSNLTLANGTVWNMTASSNVTNLTNDVSIIDFAPSANGAFKTLTTRNYAGAGGTIGLNTFLRADGSPSDRLVIDGGTATGSTSLRITNAGGPGAYTTANGIRVVDAVNGGTTAADAFALAGEVRAGFHTYRLYRNGFNGSNPDDWFLRSDFNGANGNGGNGPNGGGGNGGGDGANGDPGNGPITPPHVLPPPALPEDLPPVLPPGIYPIIGPEIATYGAVQPTARQLGLATLGTLHERIGDTLAIGNAGTSGEGWARSVWARGFGEQIKNRYRAFADPRTDGHLIGFQSGIDLWRGSLLPGHRDGAGLYIAYARSDVGVTGRVTNEAATNYVLRRTGSLDLDAWSGGAYWTHYGPGGWYLDAVLQATAYEGTASTSFAHLKTNGTGFVSSLEAGYPIPVPALGLGFVLEPQGQIVWQHVSFDDAHDGLGDVALGSTSGASGRLGLRGRWTVVTEGGQVWQPYLRADLWQDWNAQATTTYAGIDLVPLLQEGTRLDLSTGVTARISDALSLYAQAGYQFAVGDTDGRRRDGVRGNLGLRYTW